MGKKTGADPDIDFTGGPDANKGIIVDQSHLTSSEFEGVNLVLGITEKRDSETFYDVSILSPSYEPLEETQNKRTSIASTATVDDLHVFYLHGADDKAISIYDFSYSTKNKTELQDTNKIIPGSCLAAYSVHNDRYVIYQGLENRQLYEYNCSTASFIQIKNSTGAQDGTPIAVTYDKTTRKVYLYYTIESLELRRIIKDNDKWGPSAEVPGATKVLLGSKVSATLANEVNHVFYVEDKKALTSEVDETPKFKHLRDPVDLPESIV